MTKKQKKQCKQPITSPEEQYQKLREVWYKKLSKAGFEDAEENENSLKQYSSRFATPVAIRNWHAKSEYYSMAGQFLHNYKFESPLQKTIWEYHLNGIGVRDIAKLLKRVKIFKPNKDNIQKIIADLVIKMKEMYLVK